MRSVIEKALGVGSFIDLRGKTYQCSPIRLRHFAEARAFLAHLLPDPVKELADEKETFSQFPPEVQKALAVKALEIREDQRSISGGQASAWINGEEGGLFMLWCMVRNHHKEFSTFQSVLDVFTPGDEDKELSPAELFKIQHKVDEMFGVDQIREQAKANADKKKANRSRKKELAKRKR